MTQLTTDQLLEAAKVLAQFGVIQIVDEDPVKVAAAAATKNGKVVEIGTMKGLELVSRYVQVGNAFAKAKQAFEDVQDEVKEIMGDASELKVEGIKDPIATFRWGAKTTFDKEAAREEDPVLIQKHTHTDPEGTRTFRFPGVKATQ